MATQVTLHEDGLYTLTITHDTSTLGRTVEAYFISGGTSTLVGSSAGVAASTEFTISCDLEGLAPGFYTVEVVAGKDSTNPTTVIPTANANPYRVYIDDVTVIA